MRRLILATLVAVLPASAAGQTGQEIEQRPTITVQTNLVMLPVTVVDRRGQFVAGLTREQFTVFDNDEAQPIQFFTSEAVPATVGLVVDCSTSMRGRREEVAAAAAAFIDAAHPLDEMFSINFNEFVWPGLPGGVTFAGDVGQLRQALARAPANGMTALYDATSRALDYLARGTHDRKALIVISDGGDNASTLTLAAVLDQARRASAAIYTITLSDPNNHDGRPDVLRRLARETGGEVYFPKNSAQVANAFGRVGREIRSGYMIGLSPPTAVNGFRTIRVVVNPPDGTALTVRTRAGYYANGTR